MGHQIGLPKYPDRRATTEEEQSLCFQLITDPERARAFASEILVRCTQCTDAKLHFAPLSRFTLRQGSDGGVDADYKCADGHTTKEVPLTEMARVAVTAIHTAESVELPQEPAVANEAQAVA